MYLYCVWSQRLNEQEYSYELCLLRKEIMRSVNSKTKVDKWL